MEGISKEKLEQIYNDMVRQNREYASLINSLLSECKELDPWLPIDENTPKDGEEIQLCSMFDQAVCYWRDDEVMTGWTWGLGNKYLNPTHWKKLSPNPHAYKELPPDPKE